MNTQQSLTDIEYQGRRRQTKRDNFLETMDRLVPWKAWSEKVEPFYYPGERGRKPIPIERMLRMLMLSVWFDLSDEATEDAIYDSYAMRKFMGLTFERGSQVPDATKLCKFRNFMNQHGLQKELFAQVQEVLRANGMEVRGGTIVDATIIEASRSVRNQEQKRDPEMHSTRKGSNYYFGMRAHIGVDPVHGFVHTVICTPANKAECKVAPHEKTCGSGVSSSSAYQHSSPTQTYVSSSPNSALQTAAATATANTTRLFFIIAPPSASDG